jgi:hypothetical protein
VVRETLITHASLLSPITLGESYHCQVLSGLSISDELSICDHNGKWLICGWVGLKEALVRGSQQLYEAMKYVGTDLATTSDFVLLHKVYSDNIVVKMGESEKHETEVLPWDDPQQTKNPKNWPFARRIAHTLPPVLNAFVM